MTTLFRSALSKQQLGPFLRDHVVKILPGFLFRRVSDEDSPSSGTLRRVLHCGPPAAYDLLSLVSFISGCQMSF